MRPAAFLLAPPGTRPVGGNTYSLPLRSLIGLVILLIGCFLSACAEGDRIGDASWRQRKIAIVSVEQDKDGKKTGISVMNADGSKKVFITPWFRRTEGPPAWSPDGKQIAFVEGYSPDVKEPKIHIVNADGSGLVPLQETQKAMNPADLVWSPDGTRIAFAAARFAFTPYGRTSYTDIYVVNADGSGLTNLTSDEHNDYLPAWSPDGQKLAFISTREGPGDIFLMNADGSQPHRLTTTPYGHACFSPCGPRSPRWSPDGTKIAYTLGGIKSGWQSDVHIVNVDGSGNIPLIASEGRDEHPAWSPDGKRLAFTSVRDGNAEVYLVNADGSGLVRLTKHQAYDGFPEWLPGGAKIVFVSERSQGSVPYLPNPELYLMNPDGSRQTRLDARVLYDSFRGGLRFGIPFACAPR